MTTKDKGDGPRPFHPAEKSGASTILAIEPSMRGLLFDRPRYWDEQKPFDLLSGGIGVVSVEGPLEHHGSAYAWFDSYDAIVKRVEEAMCDDAVSAVVLCLDSPGGLANGTVEAHRKIRALSKEHGKPVLAYSNENCFSAAYAIASAADEIWLPETGAVGSVGVIGQVVSTVGFNKKIGYEVRLVTTGARKADTHPERKITPEILKVTQARVDQFGASFFGIVAESRGMSVDDVKALEAGVFLGEEAVESGLADAVGSFEEFLAHVRETVGSRAAAPNKVGAGKGVDTMRTSVKRQLTKAVEAAEKAVAEAEEKVLACESPAEKKSAMSALASAQAALIEAKYKKVTHERKTTEEDDSEEEEEAKDSDSDEEEEADSDSDTDDSDDTEDSDTDDSEEEESEEEEDDEKSPDMDDEEEDEEDEDEEEEKAAASVRRAESALADARVSMLTAHGPARVRAKRKVDAAKTRLSSAKSALSIARSGAAARKYSALQAAVAKATGKVSLAEQLGALEGIPALLKATAQNTKRLAALEGRDLKSRVDSIIKQARDDRKVTRSEVEQLRELGMEKGTRWLKGYLAVRPKLVRSESDAIAPNENVSFAQIAAAQRQSGGSVLQALTADQRKIVSESVKSRRQAGEQITEEEYAAQLVDKMGKSGAPRPPTH